MRTKEGLWDCSIFLPFKTTYTKENFSKFFLLEFDEIWQYYYFYHIIQIIRSLIQKSNKGILGNNQYLLGSFIINFLPNRLLKFVQLNEKQ